MSEGSFPPNSASSDRALRGIALTLAGGALWGVNGTVSKYIMATYDVDPLWFVCVKELTACWLFLAMAALRKRASLKEVLHTPRALAGILRFAIGAILFSQVAYLEAINWTNAGTATVLQSLSMALVLVVVCIRSKRRPRRREALGLVLAFGGTYLVATGGDPSTLSLPLGGLLWGLICAVAAASLTILPVRLMRQWGNFVVNGLAFLFSGLLLSALFRPWEHMPSLDGVGWACIGFSVVFGTFGAYALYLQGVKEVGSVRGSLLGTSEPVVATISSVVFLGTSFSAADLLGFAAIIATVFLTA
ncbi:MAG: DMT family transporter [Atopobiaceae bacterium]|jgi:drug/metabolite transporter (DMT)-like permease|nr:DMT family transporter [Atopobiaceae bacterium]